MKVRFLVDYPKPNVNVQFAAGTEVDLPNGAEFVRDGYAERVAIAPVKPEPKAKPKPEPVKE